MDTVLVDVTGGVRTVTLNRPAQRNAMSADMLARLEAAFDGTPGDDERVAVIRSTGSVFCAGLDLKERLAGGPPSNESPVEKLFHRVENWPLPVVAVVQGEAIAGGNELALHCDFVVASTKAAFGMSLAQIGIAPTWFLCKKLMEVAGPTATREVLLLGDPIPSVKMAEWGLIARAVPPHRLESEAQMIIDRLLANAPLSLRAMKAVIVRQLQYRDQIPHEDVDALVALARQSADAREGVAARVEKRTPRFEGR